MKNIQKNKKSWFKGLVVAGVFAISVLNLSVDFRRDAAGDIDLGITSTKAMADDSETFNQWLASQINNYQAQTISCTVYLPTWGGYGVSQSTGSRDICSGGGSACFPTICW